MENRKQKLAAPLRDAIHDVMSGKTSLTHGDRFGRTLLMRALMSANCPLKAIRPLLDAGSDLKVMDDVVEVIQELAAYRPGLRRRVANLPLRF